MATAPLPKATSGIPNIDKWYQDAIAHTHSLYDAQLAQLGSSNASAMGGVNQYAQQTQQRLGALGQDAYAQDKLARQRVSKNYGGANAALGGDFEALLADLQRQGADTTGLGAEYAARKASLSDAGARQGTMSDRLTQILGQAMNERKGSAKQVQQASLNDLARVFAEGKNQAKRGETEALYQLQQQYQQQVAAAQAAAARSGGGGGGGGGGAGGLTPATILAWAKFAHEKGGKGSKGKSYNDFLKYMTANRSGPLDPVTHQPTGYQMSPGEMAYANEYLDQISGANRSGTRVPVGTIMQQIADTNYGFDKTGLVNMFQAIQRDQAASQVRGATPGSSQTQDIMQGLTYLHSLGLL